MPLKQFEIEPATVRLDHPPLLDYDPDNSGRGYPGYGYHLFTREWFEEFTDYPLEDKPATIEELEDFLIGEAYRLTAYKHSHNSVPSEHAYLLVKHYIEPYAWFATAMQQQNYDLARLTLGVALTFRRDLERYFPYDVAFIDFLFDLYYDGDQKLQVERQQMLNAAMRPNPGYSIG